MNALGKNVVNVLTSASFEDADSSCKRDLRVDCTAESEEMSVLTIAACSDEEDTKLFDELPSKERLFPARATALTAFHAESASILALDDTPGLVVRGDGDGRFYGNGKK